MRASRDPLELIAKRNRVPEPERLPGPDSPFAQSLLQEIIEADRGQNRERRAGGRWTRRGVLIAVALIVLTGAVAAAATSVFSPDPADVKAVLEEASEAESVHLPGWRPELASERVWCMYGPREGADTSASEFPLDQPLTVDRLISECARGNDVARNQERPPDAFTLCRATFADDAYRGMLASADATVLAGDPLGPHPGFPVALGWKADCATTRLETSWPVALAPLSSLADMNRARQVEVGLKAASARACVGRSEADALAREARRDLGERWLLIDWHLDLAPACFEVQLDPQWGTIFVVGDDTAPVAR